MILQTATTALAGSRVKFLQLEHSLCLHLADMQDSQKYKQVRHRYILTGRTSKDLATLYFMRSLTSQKAGVWGFVSLQWGFLQQQPEGHLEGEMGLRSSLYIFKACTERLNRRSAKRRPLRMQSFVKLFPVFCQAIKMWSVVVKPVSSFSQAESIAREI